MAEKDKSDAKKPKPDGERGQRSILPPKPHGSKGGASSKKWATSPGWAGKTDGVFLPKHRQGHPGGYSE